MLSDRDHVLKSEDGAKLEELETFYDVEDSRSRLTSFDSFFDSASELPILPTTPQQVEVLDDITLQSRSSPSVTNDRTRLQSLRGNWCGTYTYASLPNRDGLVSFTISVDDSDSGIFTGAGTDVVGTFNLRGERSGDQLSFLKEYKSKGIVWRYEGLMSVGM